MKKLLILLGAVWLTMGVAIIAIVYTEKSIKIEIIDLSTNDEVNNIEVTNNSTESSILNALQKIEGLDDLALNTDVRITITKAEIGNDGKVVLTAIDGSKYLTGSTTLVIDAAALRYDLSTNTAVQGIVVTNDSTNTTVLAALNNALELNLVEGTDVRIIITPAQEYNDGKVMIAAIDGSKYVVGTANLKIPQLFIKVDLSTSDDVKNIKVTNDSTPNSVLASLKQISGLENLTADDVTITINKAINGETGSVVIEANDGSKYVTGMVSLTIPVE